MTNTERDIGAAGKIIMLEGQQNTEPALPPWMFQHNDLIQALSISGFIDKQKLTNILNFLHFKKEPIYALLKHDLYKGAILVKCHPAPCLGDELTCRWDRTYSGFNLERYLLQYLIITHNQSVIVIPASFHVTECDGLTIQLPEQSHLISERQVPRFACHDVKADLWQNGFQAEGELLDFSPSAFRIRVQTALLSSFHWFNSDVPATIRLSSSQGVLFSGNCKCIHVKKDGRNREIVLAPAYDQIKRFEAKTIRNPRRQPCPPCNAIFEHPFFKKKIQREIFDISTSGFSILDKLDEVVLMPGMIIPDMNIVYMGILTIGCKAQVIYRKEENGQIRFGIAILDMHMTNYNNLNQLMNNIQGVDTAMFNEVDLDELWEFFFDTDFIYPAKYKSIQSIKDDFRDTYRRLYEDTPEIAKHFTYQRNGRILSHISILRAYERTWLAHHLAARPIPGKPLGLGVLKLLVSYLNDICRLPAANMEYIISYYSSGKRLPEHLYGKFTREEANPQLCSLDLFTYLKLPAKKLFGQLPRGWSLRRCSDSDLWEFEQFYKHHSGGLFWNVLDLKPNHQGEKLENVYNRLGFIRKWQAFSLTCIGDVKAVIIDEESNAGINLSNLLNGFKVFVMDPHIHPDILFAAVSEIPKDHSNALKSLLIYPDDYTRQEGIDFEKKHYFMWILDMQHRNAYIKYLERKFRIRLT